MNSRRLVTVAALWSGLALAAPDGGIPGGRSDGGVCEVNPKSRYNVHLDRAPLSAVINTISDVTCKTVVIGSGVEDIFVTISASKALTSGDFFAAFVAAVEASGLTIVEKGGIVRITK
jgi:type II secretory pathway component GspD/PulD (secretin)